jgi:hypothetical protein
MILDVQELVVFLASYPRLYRQPYSMHHVLGNSMFGRQMETKLIIVLTPKTGKGRLGPGRPVRPGPKGGLTGCPVASLAQKGHAV